MKIKLTKAQIEEILANPEKAHEAGIKTNDPWWVIVLKVIAYLIGLILAGAVLIASGIVSILRTRKTPCRMMRAFPTSLTL